MHALLDSVPPRWFTSLPQYLKAVQEVATKWDLHKGGIFYRGVNDVVWSLSPGAVRAGGEDTEASVSEDVLVVCGVRGGGGTGEPVTWGLGGQGPGSRRGWPDFRGGGGGEEIIGGGA